MFFAEGQIRVHLYGEPTDMRKSYDGLQALARYAMQRAPLDGALYVIEDDIRVRALTGKEKRLHRLTHSKPIVDHFFFWVPLRQAICRLKFPPLGCGGTRTMPMNKRRYLRDAVTASCCSALLNWPLQTSWPSMRRR